MTSFHPRLRPETQARLPRQDGFYTESRNLLQIFGRLRSSVTLFERRAASLRFGAMAGRLRAFSAGGFVVTWLWRQRKAQVERRLFYGETWTDYGVVLGDVAGAPFAHDGGHPTGH